MMIFLCLCVSSKFSHQKTRNVTAYNQVVLIICFLCNIRQYKPIAQNKKENDSVGIMVAHTTLGCMCMCVAYAYVCVCFAALRWGETWRNAGIWCLNNARVCVIVLCVCVCRHVSFGTLIVWGYVHFGWNSPKPNSHTRSESFNRWPCTVQCQWLTITLVIY